MQSPKSPLHLFFESLRSSERLRGVAVLFGARSLDEQGAPPRVLVVPTSAEYVPAEDHVDSLRDVPLVVEVRIWGDGATHVDAYDQAVDVRNRVLRAANDYQLELDDDDSVRVELIGETNDIDPDSNRQGHELTITFVVRAPVEDTPLEADSHTGEINSINRQPG